jgi:Tol biopolymer transport system component
VFYVGLGYFTDIFEYNIAQDEITQLTHLPRDVDLAYHLSISPDGQQVVFERRADDFDSDSSIWLMNIDGSGLRKLLDDAGRPAWGLSPVPPTPRAYLPLLLR